MIDWNSRVTTYTYDNADRQTGIAYPNGVGLIKLMGRHSGFIAATAALAQQDANFVLIPEVDFDLDGPKGLMAALEARVISRMTRRSISSELYKKDESARRQTPTYAARIKTVNTAEIRGGKTKAKAKISG